MKHRFLILNLIGLLYTQNLYAATSGNCGPVQSGDGTPESPYVYANNCTWHLENGTLTISGKGAMADYYFSGKGTNAVTTAPWGTDVQNLVINSGITHLGERAFTGLKQVTTLTIPDTVKSIGWDAFWNMSEVSGTLIVPDSVTSIGHFTFQDMDKVTNLVIGNAVNSIGNYAFEDMDGLTNLVIPDSVTSIGENAFQDMRALETLVIGDSVTAIGKDAFKNISPSAKIYCTKNSDCLTDTLANPDNVITYFKDKSGLFALTNENGDILEDTNGNPIYYLSANDMTAQSNACLGGYQTCAEQALHNKALALLEKGRVCQTFDTCQALVNTDYNGDVIKLGGKDYASLSDLLKGISMPKRIYTVEEAAALSKKTGNTFRLRYK